MEKSALQQLKSLLGKEMKVLAEANSTFHYAKRYEYKLREESAEFHYEDARCKDLGDSIDMFQKRARDAKMKIKKAEERIDKINRVIEQIRDPHG